jgi:type VI secretion system protein ImpA
LGYRCQLPEIGHIDGAFLEAELEEVVATADSLDRALAAVAGIESFVTEQVGAVNAPDLSELTKDLHLAKGIVAERLARRGIGDGADAGAAESGGVAAGISGAINSREDVVWALDRICDYFQRNEPTSPVPHYLRRAQKLVAMDFLDILREMTPDGVHQAETIFGVRSEEQ